MSRCYIVMGMHRSGTSLMAKILYKSGIQMGSEGFMTPDITNADGYYENRYITSNNEKILQQAGYTWWKPKEVIGNKKVAKLLVDKYKKPLWGMKDPRFTFTLGTYLPFIENPTIIIMRRDKLSVVKSLMETHKKQIGEFVDEKFFEELYDKYWTMNKKWMKRLPFIVIDYEALMSSVNPKLKHF